MEDEKVRKREALLKAWERLDREVQGQLGCPDRAGWTARKYREMERLEQRIHDLEGPPDG